MKRVLVIGGSSGIGLECVRQLLQMNYHVCAFSRHAHLIDFDHANLCKISGDALVAAEVSRVLEGVDLVIQSLGVPFNKRMITGPITLFSQATSILIPAMHQAGILRLIAVTGFGAGESSASIGVLQRPFFNLMFGRAYADKTLQEQQIKDSDLHWTIVRPGVLGNGRARADYQVLMDPNDWRNGLISRASVADYMVQLVESGGYIGCSPVLVN